LTGSSRLAILVASLTDVQAAYDRMLRGEARFPMVIGI
jgi:hypothetical protein